MEDSEKIEQYTLEELESELKQSHKDFIREYIVSGWNQVKSYMKVYPDSSYAAAAVSANEILKKPKIRQYLNYMKEDLEKICMVNKASMLNELLNIARSNIAHLHNTWIELTEFENLTDDQKSIIESIDTKVLKKNIGTRDEPEVVDVEYVKISLYSKTTAIDMINKMLGYNMPEKKELTGKDGSPLMAPFMELIKKASLNDSPND